MAVTLSPIGNGFQFFSVGGLPLSGGLLYTYTAGTSTPLTSYTDSAGLIANTNPIVLDAGGRPPAEIWLTTGSAYKFVLTDSLSTPIGPALDNITGIANLNNATLTGNTVIGTTGNTLNVANSALVVSSGNTAVGGDRSVAGNTALGNAVGDLVTFNAATIAAPNNPAVSGDWSFSGSTVLGNALGDTLSVAGGALKVFSDGRVSGNKLHNIGTVTGTTDQFIASGTYSPSFTLVTNATSASASITFQWMRVGNVCTVSGRMFVDPTAANTLTQVGFSLPIASALSDAEHCSGTAVRVATLVELSGYVIGDPANVRAELDFYNDADTASSSWAIHFTYLIQ